MSEPNNIRRSQRINKGQPPTFLKENFIMSNPDNRNNSSTSEEEEFDSDSTILENVSTATLNRQQTIAELYKQIERLQLECDNSNREEASLGSDKGGGGQSRKSPDTNSDEIMYAPQNNEVAMTTAAPSQSFQTTMSQYRYQPDVSQNPSYESSHYVTVPTAQYGQNYHTVSRSFVAPCYSQSMYALSTTSTNNMQNPPSSQTMIQLPQFGDPAENMLPNRCHQLPNDAEHNVNFNLPSYLPQTSNFPLCENAPPTGNNFIISQQTKSAFVPNSSSMAFQTTPSNVINNDFVSNRESTQNLRMMYMPGIRKGTENIPSCNFSYGNDYAANFNQLLQPNTTGYNNHAENRWTHPAPGIQNNGSINNSQNLSRLDSRKKLYDLPEFHGSPEEWPMFIAAYQNSTTAYGYSNLENLFRLQKCLKGNARKAVSSMLIYPENISDAISQLEFEFGRKECLIRSQIEMVRRIMPIGESQIEKMIPFATKVRNLSAFLQTTNSIQHLANPMLMEELVNKLPIAKRVEWAKYANNFQPYATVVNFSDWINQEARYISQVVVSTIPTASHRQLTAKPVIKNNSVLHASESTTENEIKCECCNKSHKIQECQDFQNLTLARRWEIVKSERLCFACLKVGHNTFICRNKKPCGKDGCRKRHHVLLHEVQTTSVSSSANENIAVSKVNTVAPASSSAVYSCQQKVHEPKTVLFKVVPIKAFGNGKIVSTFAMLDEGSSITMIDESLATELNLDCMPMGNLTLKWFDDVTTTQPSAITNVEICGIAKECQKQQLNNIRTVKNLQLPIQSLSINQLHTRYHNLKSLPIASYTDAKPRILIGVDNCHVGMTYKSRAGKDNEPIVVKTKLGWIVYGQTQFGSTEKAEHPEHILHVSEADEKLIELHQTVQEYFTTENFGVLKPSPSFESEADARARHILQSSTVQKSENRFETGLLWKSENIVLPNNLAMAVRRLAGMERKMKREPDFAHQYRNNIHDYLKKGYARKLSTEEARQTSARTWYLPHFGVRNPSKPNKLRLVFDAAAAVDGISLNSMLLTGPDQYQSLTSILHRFRQGDIGVCGDIREMFHQIHIQPCDQDAQRFIWRDESTQPIEFFTMIAMTFGATCSPCSAQYVKNVNARRFESQFPKAVEAILNDHYVDDYVKSFDTVIEAIDTTKSVINVHREGGFELRGFVSNSPPVANAFGHDENQQPIVNMNIPDKAVVEKILGMYWDTKSDEFMFKLQFHKVPKEVTEYKRSPTKRELLSIVMSVYDPFGLLANFMIYSKVLIQDAWRTGIEWDADIPEEISRRFMSWQKELNNVTNLRVPRCHSPRLNSAKEIQLHIFVDASETAFAAVAYFRIVTNDNDVEISFVSGKTKCAPLKLLSVPRLELQSAVLGVRMRNSIIESYNVQPTSCFFWSDSKTVIQWIQSDHRRYKPFVAHRIAEILESTVINSWRWIPTKLNVADDATRTKLSPAFTPNSRWVVGPEFLRTAENDWPQESIINDQENMSEVRASCLLVNCYIGREPKLVKFLERFSSYRRALRVIAWIRRYFYNRFGKSSHRSGGLHVDEIKEVEMNLCRTVQQATYPEEYTALKKSQAIDKSSPIYQLTPQFNEYEVMVLGGRIDNAICVGSDTRRPIILPKKHQLTQMIVAQYHERFHHQNHNTIICEIRRKYWIPHLSSLVKSHKIRCMECKIKNCKPEIPLEGQLPQDRVTPFIRPFTYSGLDYFGPVLVTIGRRTEKRWVALFTCLTIRAVHLELATDMSTDSCILCIRNFVNRRGIPIRIRSDCGTNFIGADHELRRAMNIWDQNQITNLLTMQGIEWVFNCPANPNAGGCWERMVGSVKRVLHQTLKEAAPRVETLRSLLIEAENIVNSRPLTHVPVESDADEPLTPNHFLMGTANSTQTPGTEDAELFDCRKQWRISQQLKNCFWKRWIREYLPTLTRRTKWFQNVTPLQVDDVVIVCDDTMPRSQWSRGRIIKVNSAKDGQVRSVEVKTAKGVMRRPASKIARLDISKSDVGQFTGVGMLRAQSP